MKVLLATDGSRYAEWAVELLLQFPLLSETEITVLTAVPWVDVELPKGEAIPNEHQQAIATVRKANEATARELVEGIRKALAPRWKDVGTWIKYGTPSAEIIEAAEVMRADLVILGAKGLSGLKGFLLGSVVQKVVRYAPCSVLVVKRKPEALHKILVALDRSAYASTDIGRYRLRFEGLRALQGPTHIKVEATFWVTNQEQPLGTLRPALRFYEREQTPIAEVDKGIGLWEDLYVILGRMERDGREIAVKALVNPMVTWIWLGGAVMALGGLLALWPERRFIPKGSPPLKEG